MFRSLDYSNTLSMKLSEVLDDIGINEEMVMKRRRVLMIKESMNTIANRSDGNNFTTYYLGSQSEGTTTIGLASDIDILFVNPEVNVIKDWSDWKQNKSNLLMIQDENVTPGYCFLQVLRSDEPLPETNIPDERFIRDCDGRILLKNTCLGVQGDAVRQGPSNAVSGVEGYCDADFVMGFSCSTSPLHLLERQGMERCWSQETIGYAASTSCLVVGTSSKISIYPELEWRISTSLAERCFMFNLNITQIRCYVLMKMILKTFLNPRKENGLSSFMCKNVLLHCIGNSDKRIWEKNHLLACLPYCMIMLYSSIQNDVCSHFMIPENNLIAGQLNVVMKRDLLRKISDIVHSSDRYLLCIKIDNIGQRLHAKMSIISDIGLDIPTSHAIKEACVYSLNVNLATEITKCQKYIYHLLKNNNLKKLIQSVQKVTNYSVNGNTLEQFSSRCIAPFLYSILGSILVSSSIRHITPLSKQALMCLSLGLNSDVTSGRLKLASVFYCTGNMYRSEFILRQIERRSNSDAVVPVCSCWDHPLPAYPAEVFRKLSEQSEDRIIHVISCCVKFMPIEVNCVPRELQYEMVRSSRDDRPYRSFKDKDWMDFAVVDSLPFLSFLQYKTYGHLQRSQDQQRALTNLARTIETYTTVGHRETALNLLGQCMEQENRQREALQCYMRSLQQRPTNNAAKIHISKLLASLVNQ